MLASALLSSIDRRLLYAVIVQFPLCKQGAIGAIRDQRIDRLDDRLLQGPIFDWQGNARELGRHGPPDRAIGAVFEIHDVRQGRVALNGGVDAPLLELRPRIARAVRADEEDRIAVGLWLASRGDVCRAYGARAC